MTFAHVIELDSQAELLDRLSLLTNFGSNLIAVNGQDGYGKSWLAQRYLELGASNKNQCLLLCHPNQDDVQRRMLILQQLVSDALFNQQDTLLDSLERILDCEACDIAIVVDDAHLMSEALVSELWGLVLAAQANPKWKINILLFTQSRRLEPVLSRISYGQELKPVELDIEMLSEIEARRFFESLVIRYVDDESEKRVRDAFKKVAPIPGDIMALGEMKVERRIIIRSIVGSPLNITLVVLALLLCAAGGYWWMYNQPGPDDKAQQITGAIEQTAIPTLSDPQAQTDDAGSTNNGEAAENTALTDATDDSDSLPPTVTEEVASVGTENKQQRIVIESGVVDALLESKPAEVNADKIKQAVEESAPQAQSSARSSLIKVVQAGESAPEAQPTSAKSVVKFSFAREELKALSPRGYTLQLGAMTTMDDVQSFLDKHDLNTKVRIYPTVRSGAKWYIITYQDYPTIQSARDAVESLPDALKSLGPWAKSLGQVHREIDRVK
ncbi:AAA family ATPase [Vibrio sp. AND4]|uniref:SPOR domain-containing protein n=1 Tax=Vibrio sp. AND4 TaxID=314289 RepID=UPI00015F040E|nr:AAA family ATPase [Vibrio sp. AND4]EDP57930.1 DamX-related protein [Vibrio sp. AND4]